MAMTTLYRSPIVIIGLASLSVPLCYGALSALPDFRTSVPILVLITAIITVLITGIHHITITTETHLPSWIILGIAAMIRIMLVFRPPELSNDIYRYIWDGLQTTQGINPYALAPAEAHPAPHEEAHLLSLINHPNLVTIYPPGA